MSEIGKQQEKVQFNARVSPECRRGIKMDSASLEIGIDLISEAIITHFYSQFPNEKDRHRIYVEHERAKAVPAMAAA